MIFIELNSEFPLYLQSSPHPIFRFHFIHVFCKLSTTSNIHEAIFAISYNSYLFHFTFLAKEEEDEGKKATISISRVDFRISNKVVCTAVKLIFTISFNHSYKRKRKGGKEKYFRVENRKQFEIFIRRRKLNTDKVL